MDASGAIDEVTAADADFTTFVRATSTSLHRTAYLLTGSREAAQDAVQTALTKIYLAWNRRDTWDSPEAYARRSVVNVVLSARRRRWFGEQPRGEQLESLMSATTDATSSIAERDALRRALQALPARQRTAVVLRHYVDLSEAETAAAMDCPVGTVKSLTARALKTLRVQVEEAVA